MTVYEHSAFVMMYAEHWGVRNWGGGKGNHRAYGNVSLDNKQ